MSLQKKLHEILALHDQNQQKDTLPLSLGDSFLFNHNSVFKNIRQHSLKLGYSFTTNDFCHYNVLPYASLPKILQEKKVPYSDNVSVLRDIELRFPNRFRCEELVKVKSNYTLHESSHCVADHYLKEPTFDPRDLHLIPSANSQKAFKLIMAESFANAIESIANAYNLTPEQRFFYELNSYVTHNKKVNTHLLHTLELIGLKNTFQLIYISYLFSNSLNPDVSHQVFLQILKHVLQEQAVFNKAKDHPAPKKLFSHGFELSLDFRLQTTGFFCAYSGLNTPLQQLLKWDTLELVIKSNAIKKFLDLTCPA